MRILTFISLSILVLVTSVGVPFYGHLCLDSNQVSFNTDHNCSNMQANENASCHSNKMMDCDEGDMSDCCQDELHFVQMEVDYTAQVEDVTLNPNLLFSISFFYNVIAPFISVENPEEKVDFNYYSPPIPIRDIPVEIQSFLI